MIEPSPPPAPFLQREFAGSADSLHHRAWPVPMRREVWLLTPARRAIALGSSQSLSSDGRAEAERLGIDVTIRRSGGGAVWLDPAGSSWIDVFLPAGDPLWTDDVSLAPLFLGRAFARVLAGHTVDGIVHTGPMIRTEWSDIVCFAGVGPGEVIDAATGAKLVGISQRRTRSGARFQCVMYRRYSDEILRRISGIPANAELPAVRAVDLTAQQLFTELQWELVA